MADDIATLGFAVDTSQLKSAATDLDKFGQAAKSAVAPSGALEAAAKRVGVSVEEMRQRVAAAGQTALTNGKATDEAAAAHARMSTQAMSLQHALRGSIEQLALGVSPTQALTAQMNHLVYAASGPQGLSGAFAEVRGTLGSVISGIGGYITPLRTLAAGVVGMGAAALTAAYDWQSAQKDIDKSMIGIGQRSGATIHDINNFTSQVAATSNIATGSARDVLLELVKSGGVYKENLTGIANVTRSVSILTGKDMVDSAKMLGSAFSGDLVKGADELNSKFGFLDGKTRELIHTLQDHNQVAQAQAVLYQNLGPAVQRAVETLSPLEKAWNAITKAASDAKNAVGQALSPPTDEQRLQQLTAQQNAALAGGDRPARSASYRSALAQTGMIGTTQGMVGDLVVETPGAPLGINMNQIAGLSNAIGEVQKKIDAAAKAAADARFKQFSLEADNAVRALIPQISQTEALTKALEDLRRAQETPEVKNNQGLAAQNAQAITAGNVQKQIIAETESAEARRNSLLLQLQQSYGGVSIEVAQILQTENDQLAVAKARTGQEQLAAQELSTINQLLLQGKTLMEATSVAALQRQVTQENINKSVEDQTRALQQQTQLLGASPENAPYVKAAQAYQNAIKQGADETQAAALKAATLANELTKAASAADQQAAAEAKAAEAESQAQFSARVSAANGTFNSTTGSISSPTGGAMNGGNAQTFTSTIMPANWGQLIANSQASQNATDLLNAINSSNAYSDNQKTQAQIQQLQIQKSLLPQQYNVNPLNPNGFQNFSALANQQKVATQSQIIDIQIQDLQKHLDDLTKATTDNTAATQANTDVTLNPLYSGGHASIGYYHAAGGLDGTVTGGTPGVDSVPIHIMAQRGERVMVTPNNDNRRSTNVTTVINVTGNDTPQRRRNARQAAQQIVSGVIGATG